MCVNNGNENGSSSNNNNISDHRTQKKRRRNNVNVATSTSTTTTTTTSTKPTAAAAAKTTIIATVAEFKEKVTSATTTTTTASTMPPVYYKRVVAESETQPSTLQPQTHCQRRSRRRGSCCSNCSRITAGLKWKIILPTIILLLWRTSHVLAIRKGRLMTPSTFTALSGDLHVQIQLFSGSAVGSDGNIPQQQQQEQETKSVDNFQNSKSTLSRTPPTVAVKNSSSAPSSSTPSSLGSNTTNVPTTGGLREVENIITSTLVISKYIDEIDATTQKAWQEDELFPFHHQKQQTASPTPTTNAPPTFDESTLSSTNWFNDQQNGTAKNSLLQRRRKEIVQNIPVYPDPRHNVTQIAVPCQTFMRGGLYEMQIVTNLKTTTAILPDTKNMSGRSSSIGVVTAAPTIVQTTTTLIPVSDERLRQTLDVRWPSAEMRVSPVRLRTYPKSPVEVELRFPEVNCASAEHSPDLPDFWLELIYCGKERTCAQLPPLNVSKTNILYAEQVRGYPKQKLLKLGCELFGLAGNYAVQLRPMSPALLGVPITRRFLSVDWSDKFVFNVYARSIFPCDPHTGIGVLYEYPACILEQGDRVRVYAKLRADVATLKPPTTLHYVAEQRVVKSQYSLYFNCDLFTEKYVEYCFVYVSQAISGAVADVRMDCVPTLPVSESDTGGWGPWSEWTPCSTNCLGGTRNRYRFCDSPPPRYGAKFCEGPFVETEKCGQQNMADTWDCLYESSYGTINNNLNSLHKANRTEVSQEIGPGCRCGCIVHLGTAKPKRYIAGATQSCPGRSFWLIQVDGAQMISLSLDFLRLPCTPQYIKVRDGPSLSSTLLLELNGGSNLNVVGGGSGGGGGNTPTKAAQQLESTGAQLLVEFYAGGEETTTTTSKTNSNKNKSETIINSACTGGFLANVEQIIKNSTVVTPKNLLASATRLSSSSSSSSSNHIKSRTLASKANHHQRFRSGFTLVHLSAIIFASIIIVISAMLGAQYIVRYRKYHLAVARRRDEGSRLHTPRASLTSLQSRPPSRAMSTTTLLSEVIYMVKMRPKHQLRHSILRESVDAENMALARETGFIISEDHGELGHVTLNKCAEEMGSNASIVTLRNELNVNASSSTTPTSSSLKPLPGASSVSRTPSENELTTADVEALEQTPLDGTLTISNKEDSAKDNESIISSGMSSICNSPPMNLKRLSKYSERYDAVTLKIRNSRFNDSRASASTSTQNDSDCGGSSSLRSSLQHLSGRSASASLTNGCYSPAVSIVSTATIRTTNPKESKEKQNRRKLLARPGSEFSLGNQEELELDYYDYNVINAGAAPGSYLGMDPAYLIWIPPFEECTTNVDEIITNDRDGDGNGDGDKTPEPIKNVAKTSLHLNEAHEDETMPLYQAFKMPKYGHYLSPGSNSESTTTNTTNTTETTPTSDEISPLNSNLQSKVTTPSETYNHHKNNLIQQVISSSCASFAKPATPYMTRKQKRAFKQQSKSAHALGLTHEAIALRDLNTTKSVRNIATPTTTMTTAATTPTTTTQPTNSSLNEQPMNGSYVEKETEVVKSPSGDLHNFLALDDIEFADECESSDCYERNTQITKATTTTTTSSSNSNNIQQKQAANDNATIKNKIKQDLNKHQQPQRPNEANNVENRSREVEV